MEETRILLEENKELGKQIANDLIQFKPLLADLKRAYDALELGAFSQEIFKKLILTGANDTIAFYVTTLNEQLDKLGITSSTIRNNAIAGHDNIIQGLNQAIVKAKSFRPELPYSRSVSLSLKFISFNDGFNDGFIVSDEDMEALLEKYCRTYIEEHEKQFLDLAKELETAYNKFLKVVEEQKVMPGDRLNCLHLILSLKTNGEAAIDSGKLKSLITYQQRIAKYTSRA